MHVFIAAILTCLQKREMRRQPEEGLFCQYSNLNLLLRMPEWRDLPSRHVVLWTRFFVLRFELATQQGTTAAINAGECVAWSRTAISICTNYYSNSKPRRARDIERCEFIIHHRCSLVFACGTKIEFLHAPGLTGSCPSTEHISCVKFRSCLNSTKRIQDCICIACRVWCSGLGTKRGKTDRKSVV